MVARSKMDERFLIKVAFMADIFQDSVRYPTRAELNYFSGYFDKVAEFVFPVDVFEKTASYELDFDDYLDIVHANNMQDLAMEKAAVGTGMGAGGWRSGGKQVWKAPDYTKGDQSGLWEGQNPLAWGASAGDWLDRGSRGKLSTGQQVVHDLIPGVYGTGQMRQGWNEGDWGKIGKGLFWNVLDLIGVGRIPAGLKALGFMGKALKNSRFIKGLGTAARGAGKWLRDTGLRAGRWVGDAAKGAGRWVADTAKNIGSGAKKVFTGALNKAKGVWNWGKDKLSGLFGRSKKAPKTTTKTTPKPAAGGQTPRKWYHPKELGKTVGREALTTGAFYGLMNMMGGGQQQAPGAVQPNMSVAQGSGPAAQGRIGAGPGQGSYSAGSSFNLGAAPTAPRGNDSRYAGFLNKFKYSGPGAAGRSGSFFR